MTENTPTPPNEKPPFWIWQLGLSIFLLILITFVGGVLGHQAKTQEDARFRATEAVIPVKTAAQEQFTLGDQALDEERYLDAKTHFEYVLEVDPSFPDVDKKLVVALIELYAQPSATSMPDSQAIPATTPTPEAPDPGELLYQAQDLIKNKEWTLSIETLQPLRFSHPEHEPATVDGLFFTALYHRGMALLEKGDLAGGIYDLERAARFGVLDAEAQNHLAWASFYLAGMSYWKLDWGRATYYFGLVAEESPNFHDASEVTAQARYREAAQEYAQRLAEQKDWCEAERYFRIALAHGGDANVKLKAEEASQLCGGN